MAIVFSRRATKRRAQKLAEASKRYAHFIEHPDIEGLERFFGTEFPAPARAMYFDLALMKEDDLEIGVPNPLEGTTTSYVAYFHAADVESAKLAWPGNEGLVAIANNGCGDEFLIDPKQADPEVLYFLHETGERCGLGVSLSQFLKAPRRKLAEASEGAA